MAVDTLIFDFDGVILDSFPDQYAWFRHICSRLGKPFPYCTLEAFRDDYREPVYPDMYSFLGFVWEKEKEIIWEEYNRHKRTSQIDLVPGMRDALETLTSSFGLAIASSNTHDAINRQLAEHGIAQYFRTVVGKEDLPVVNGLPLLKPHPACILEALKRTGRTPQEALYIGDQITDIHACRNVAAHYGRGVPIIAMTCGYGNPQHLLAHAGEDVHIAHTPQEMTEIILTLPSANGSRSS